MAKEVFVIEFPLKVEKWQSDILNKRYEHLRQLYNYVQGKLLRQYKYLIQFDEYRQHNFSKEKEMALLEKGNKKALKAIRCIKEQFFKGHPLRMTDIRGRNGEPCDITFTKFGIASFVAKLGQRNVGSGLTYSDLGINSHILEFLSDSIWCSWERMLYDPETQRIKFKKPGELNSFASRGIGTGERKTFCGFDLQLKTMTFDVKINGKNGRNAKFITLPIKYNLKHADYEMTALSGGIESIKMVKVIRRFVRGEYKYYIQLTIEGEKPQKGRSLGKGRVGIDIGPTTIAISGNNTVSIDKLAAKCDNIEKDIHRIGRKIDRSRRAMNPDNFNDDGTVKRGIKQTWNNSARYKRLRQEMAELQRKQAAVRKAQHIERANALLSEGDIFIIENNPIKGWTARAKETKVSEKTGKIQKKKRWGKSVANHAPSMFVTILENKVKSLGGTVVKADVRNAASQYDFTDGSFTKHELEERDVRLSNGDTHQRDMLAAFNLQHLMCAANEVKQYDQEQMHSHYHQFCELEQAEIMRYKNKEKQDDRSTIAASRL